jgi:hypothetical protein
MMSRLILNLKESMEARIVDDRGYDYNTIDVTMSNIISRQLDNLELYDLSRNVNINTTASRPKYFWQFYNIITIILKHFWIFRQIM